MTGSPLDLHTATPREIAERISAERRGTPFLVYRDGSGRQEIFDFGRAVALVTIGRRPGNHVPLPWDHEVSRVHAELVRLGDEWVVADDGLSHNGTFLNGEAVTARRRLRDGDTIVVGGTTLVFCAPSESSTTVATVTAGRPTLAADITPAQRRVLLALCRPFAESSQALAPTNNEIAEELVITVDTVKSTLRALYEVFGLEALPQNHKRQMLALRALQGGLVSRRDLQ